MQRRAVNVGGRPRGSRNKRSLDLGRYVEAHFGGMTPGQQAAAVSMVTARELREAKQAARELLIVDLGLSPVVLAMVVKARRLARALHCESKEAWLLMAKEREGLLPYVHQKQPQAPDRSSAPRAVAFMVPEGVDSDTPLLALFDEDELGEMREITPESGQVPSGEVPKADKPL
jgi:hypothetical protein